MNIRTCFRGRLAAAFVAGSLMVASGRALAQSAPDDALIQQGITLRTQGRDAEALALFEQANAQFHTPRSIAQIALAEQALGRWERADQHLREALTFTLDPWITRNRAALEGALAQLQQRLCALELIDGVSGARVRIDGREVGTLPAASTVRLVRGSYTLEVEAEGYYPVRRSIDLNGASARESVEMRPRGGAQTSAGNGSNGASSGNGGSAGSVGQGRGSSGEPGGARVVSPPARPGGVAIGGVVLAVVGGVSMLSSSAFFLLRNGAESDLRGLGCVLTAGFWECTNPAAQNIHSNGNTMNALGHVALWGGLAMAGAGATWIALSAGARGEAARIAVVPMVGPGASGLVWVGRF
ncbi:MAG: PEGA domain-containing protein [Polyangiales bacterium]